MLARRLLAALAVAAFAVPGPAAQAGNVVARCGFQYVGWLGQGWSGNDGYPVLVYGVAAFDDSATHAMRCYVRVNEVEQDGTEPGTGAGLAVTSGAVTYRAAPEDLVELCAEVDGVTVRCVPSVETQIPPKEVLDAFDSAWAVVNDATIAYADPVVCAALASLAPGIPGVVDVTPDGDTTLAVYGPVWDCPPYGDLFPPS